MTKAGNCWQSWIFGPHAQPPGRLVVASRAISEIRECCNTLPSQAAHHVLLLVQQICHGAEELRNTLSRPQLRRAFLEVSNPQTRAALGHAPAQRTVILASGFSAAHVYRANKEGEDGSCPQGYWHHMMWDCPENPPGVTTPGNALTRRLGWISKDPESAAALAHMSATVLRLWTIRHGNAAGRGL